MYKPAGNVIVAACGASALTEYKNSLCTPIPFDTVETTAIWALENTRQLNLRAPFSHFLTFFPWLDAA